MKFTIEIKRIFDQLVTGEGCMICSGDNGDIHVCDVC